MTNEEILEVSDEALNRLDETSDEFFRVLEDICTGHSSIGELDDAYKSLKATCKDLNRLAKAWRKNNPVEETADEQ